MNNKLIDEIKEKANELNKEEILDLVTSYLLYLSDEFTDLTENFLNTTRKKRITEGFNDFYLSDWGLDKEVIDKFKDGADIHKRDALQILVTYLSGYERTAAEMYKRARIKCKAEDIDIQYCRHKVEEFSKVAFDSIFDFLPRDIQENKKVTALFDNLYPPDV